MVLVSSVNAQRAMPGGGAYGILEGRARTDDAPAGGRMGAGSVFASRRCSRDRAHRYDPVLLARPGFVKAQCVALRWGESPTRTMSRRAVLFLACEGARHITGQVITVDSGQTIARALT
jgi:NAD(P)-dependent dehydrogenase (short-subunit alcohol dehydrogenase family)